MKKSIVMMTVLFLLAAAGAAPAAAPVDSPGAAPGASGAAPGRIAPTAPTEPPDGLAGGRSDYRAKCANCHGANALLTVQTARKLGVDPKKMSLMASEMSRDEMIAITAKGRNKMPGFEKVLAKERIAGVVDYLLDFRAKRIKKDSLIRQKAPESSNPAPAGAPAKSPAAP